MPLETHRPFAREDFIVGAGNSAAIGLVDSWPAWTAPAAALFGPAGSGKSHLASVWAARAEAQIIEAAALDESALAPACALVIENIDHAPLTAPAEIALFALLERGHILLLTGREAPAAWPAQLPDLASRFRALLAFPLWASDDAMLETLAKKLFADRQLLVPDAVVTQMIRALERSPAAVRDFVAHADRAALAQKRPITLGLIRELLANGA
ncbi:MAG: chromosomal replication initiator DnaA [Alphaproteobacteria bacterium]|nr:chromosomal replication initiator DnaA [Alphaproteobacteria bacterium]MDE2500400.1 chromosomal replication initiator DnaA [Alphaproteobacteria bacterium]